MKFTEIQGLDSEELKKRLLASREDYFQSKMVHAFGQLSNSNHLRQVRRNIARIETALTALRAKGDSSPSPSTERLQ